MTSILNLESSAPAEEPTIETPDAVNDYEIVLGRSQIASWLFVGVITLAVCSSLAYLGGEAIGRRKTARAAALKTASSVPPASMPVAAALIPQTAILPLPNVDSAPAVKTAQKAAVPVFGEPEAEKVYLQVGAVERGMAMLLCEGLRSHGFESFVAPGPHENIFRVLIGPLPDPQAFRQAMVAI